MDKNSIKGRLRWLATALTTQRNTIADILSRLRHFGTHGGSAPALRPKFMRLLTQVAVHREKENDILDEIEAMERRHQELKRGKRLRRVPLQPFHEETHGKRGQAQQTFLHDTSEEEFLPSFAAKPVGYIPPPRRSGLWKWLLLFYLLSPATNNKKQDITPG